MVSFYLDGPAISYLHHNTAILCTVKKGRGIISSLSRDNLFWFNKVGYGSLNWLFAAADHRCGGHTES
jgi:hypothetical protein